MENIRICPHCGKPVIKSELPQYVWQCMDCDEDFYDFECPVDEVLTSLWNFTMEDLENIDHWLTVGRRVCGHCKFRKENYTEIPFECRNCHEFNRRELPYDVFCPIYKEGYVPSAARRRQ